MSFNIQGMQMIEKMKKQLKDMEENKHKLEQEISKMKISINMQEHPERVCPECKSGFMYDDGFVYIDIRVCNNCNYTIRN